MKKQTGAPFRKADLQNLPLQEARKRFLDKLAEHSQILQVLFESPLEQWLALSADAKGRCREYGWVEIQYSPAWKELNPSVNDADSREEQRIRLELIPLHDSLHALASTFGLLHNGEPATWAMNTVAETLHQWGWRTKEKRVLRWFHECEYSQGYPALTDPNWIHVPTGSPEQEHFPIQIEIPPKQPDESFKAFEKRYNKVCRDRRIEYVRNLKADKWRTQAADKDFAWLDCLAKWQAGMNASQIDSRVKTAAARSTFSRGIAETARYIRITPRKSRHDPKHRAER